MVERRRLASQVSTEGEDPEQPEEQRTSRPPQKKPDGWYRERLEIDRDDLDTCLIEQPELYYHVIQEHVEAVSERDAAKLDLEEAEAEADRKIRDDFDQSGEKITEARVQQELRLVPRLQELRRRLVKLTTAVNHQVALKEAYQQRSFMLRELVALCIHQGYDQGMSSGAAEATARRAQQNREAAGEERRRRRGL